MQDALLHVNRVGLPGHGYSACSIQTPIRQGAVGSRLKWLGWTVSVNVLTIDDSSEGNNDRPDALATEFVRKPVDVIWTAGPEAAIVATRCIPIAF